MSSVSSAAGDHRPAPSDHRWLVLVIVAVAQLMVVLDATIVTIALPSAQHALAFSNSDRQWVVTAYALAFGSLLLLGGRLGDMFSRKRVFIPGLGGTRARLGRAVPHRLRVLARRTGGLDRRADHRLAGRGPGPAGSVRPRRAPGQPPPAAAAGDRGPDQGRRLRLGRPDRDRGPRHLPVPHLLPPAG